MTMAFVAVPAVKRSHHGEYAVVDRWVVRLDMHTFQFRLADSGVTLVDALGGAAIAHPVLYAGDNSVISQIALQAIDKRTRVSAHNVRIL